MSDEKKRLVDAYCDKIIAGAWSINERDALDTHLAKLEAVAQAAEKLLIMRMVEHHMPGLDADQVGCIVPCQGCALEGAVAALRGAKKGE